MSVKESFMRLIEALPNVEDFDAEIGEVTKAITSAESAGMEYEDKYNKLLSAYKTRFGEMLQENVTEEVVVPDKTENVAKEEELNLQDLNFDGSTE